MKYGKKNWTKQQLTTLHLDNHVAKENCLLRNTGNEKKKLNTKYDLLQKP